jgi:hypothetical protein
MGTNTKTLTPAFSPKPMTTTTPTLEDLLAEWWRDSYPHAAPINNQTASLIVAFAAWVLARKAHGEALL